MNFEKENEYLRIIVILVVSTGFGGDDQVYGGVMVVASMCPASRIVVKLNVNIPGLWIICYS